jgi:hypothetical protein
LHGRTIWWNSDGTDELGTVQSINAMLGGLQDMAPIIYRAKKLVVNYNHADLSVAWPGQPTSERCYRIEDLWEKPILEKIRLVGNSQEPVQELYQRFYVVTDYWQEDGDKSHLPGNKVMTAGWLKIETLDIATHADGDPQMIPFYGRRTTKIISARSSASHDPPATPSAYHGSTIADILS